MKGSGTTRTWRSKPRLVYTGRNYSPPFSMAPRPGSHTAVMSDSLNVSTSAAFALRWAGQVSRMEDHCLPKVVLYGELSTGHRDRGAPKKCYKDCLRMCLNVCHIDCLQRRLAPHSPQGCFPVWKEPERLPQRQTTEEESSSCFHHRKPRADLHVPTLHEDLPVSHRSAWTTTFLIFVREAKPSQYHF